MYSGLRIGETHTYFDFGHCIASRDTGTPTKKMATKTVPFMNGFYDFSKIYGALAFESRELTYRFDMIGESRTDLQEQKARFLDWLSSIHNEEIHDDDIKDFHFLGSFSEASFEEAESGEGGTLEVKFLCYPFMIANYYTSIELSVGTHTITNIYQAVKPVAVPATGAATVQIGNYQQSITSETQLSMILNHGENTVKVSGNAITLKWLEERA